MLLRFQSTPIFSSKNTCIATLIVPSLAMAHGQRIEFVPKLPLVIGDLATSIEVLATPSLLVKNIFLKTEDSKGNLVVLILFHI